MMRWPLVLPFVTLFAAEPAWALQPAKHRELAEAACTSAGLPSGFCRRMGKEAYETDYHEWTDLAAHAQRELDADRCTAADAAITRVDRLARDAIAKTRAGDFEAGAIALGRAVHTLQDECAHHGMTNQEHSFYSLTQTCTGDAVSPDVQPEALACAESRTRDAFAVVASALAGTQWGSADWICRDGDNRDTCTNAVLPAPWMACDFLREHKDWDGADSRWDGTKVGPALVAAFRAGMTGGAAPSPICRAGAIDPPMPRADRADLTVGCKALDIACLGKVDEDSAAESQTGGGCSTTRPGLLFALALLFVRRRKR